MRILTKWQFIWIEQSNIRQLLLIRFFIRLCYWQNSRLSLIYSSVWIYSSKSKLNLWTVCCLLASEWVNVATQPSRRHQNANSTVLAFKLNIILLCTVSLWLHRMCISRTRARTSVDKMGLQPEQRKTWAIRSALKWTEKKIQPENNRKNEEKKQRSFSRFLCSYFLYIITIRWMNMRPRLQQNWITLHKNHHHSRKEDATWANVIDCTNFGIMRHSLISLMAPANN